MCFHCGRLVSSNHKKQHYRTKCKGKEEKWLKEGEEFTKSCESESPVNTPSEVKSATIRRIGLSNTYPASRKVLRAFSDRKSVVKEQ